MVAHDPAPTTATLMGHPYTAAAMDPERSPSTSNPRRVAVLVPIKDFADAKFRLAEALSASQRSQIAREMAARVVRAAAPHPVFVVCDDPVVASWAQKRGAEVIDSPVAGLNPSVSYGFAELRAQGFDTVVISHADLPLARTFDGIADFDGVTIVPDRHGGGTNVMAVPTTLDFEFRYGAGSFPAHCDEAANKGAVIRVVAATDLQWDVDTPADLDQSLDLDSVLNTPPSETSQ